MGLWCKTKKMIGRGPAAHGRGCVFPFQKHAFLHSPMNSAMQIGRPHNSMPY